MKTKLAHEWNSYLDLFLKRNEGRPTRLGVFVGEARGTQDYWIEDGLPLASVTVEPKETVADIEMIFASKSDPDERAFTHIINDARAIRIGLGIGNHDDSLEITDCEARTTVLRFEDFAGADLDK